MVMIDGDCHEDWYIHTMIYDNFNLWLLWWNFNRLFTFSILLPTNMFIESKNNHNGRLQDSNAIFSSHVSYKWLKWNEENSQHISHVPYTYLPIQLLNEHSGSPICRPSGSRWRIQRQYFEIILIYYTKIHSI